MKMNMNESLNISIRSMGRTILTCLHAFDGIGRAVRLKYKTYELDDIIANTLRLLGEGSKVAVKITLMATETGLIQMDEDIIAIEGTGRCADTAGLIKPSNVDRFSISEFEDRRFQCEILGVVGWHMSPVLMKKVANAITAWGVNHVVPHGVFFGRNPTQMPYP
ncbi:hypothetical protein MUP95_08625, partial [bacterium]|nr:hypothetical protein [bacterium]